MTCVTATEPACPAWSISYPGGNGSPQTREFSSPIYLLELEFATECQRTEQVNCEGVSFRDSDAEDRRGYMDKKEISMNAVEV